MLERWHLAEFGMRVGLAMSAEDSSQLLDEPTASKLVPYRALFYDEEQVGRLEKFRPYAIPAGEWLQDVGHRLKMRG